MIFLFFFCLKDKKKLKGSEDEGRAEGQGSGDEGGMVEEKADEAPKSGDESDDGPSRE